MTENASDLYNNTLNAKSTHVILQQRQQMLQSSSPGNTKYKSSAQKSRKSKETIIEPYSATLGSARKV